MSAPDIAPLRDKPKPIQPEVTLQERSKTISSLVLPARFQSTLQVGSSCLPTGVTLGMTINSHNKRKELRNILKLCLFQLEVVSLIPHNLVKSCATFRNVLMITILSSLIHNCPCVVCHITNKNMYLCIIKNVKSFMKFVSAHRETHQYLLTCYLFYECTRIAEL